jgi:hypothetical protein
LGNLEVPISKSAPATKHDCVEIAALTFRLRISIGSASVRVANIENRMSELVGENPYEVEATVSCRVAPSFLHALTGDAVVVRQRIDAYLRSLISTGDVNYGVGWSVRAEVESSVDNDRSRDR